MISTISNIHTVSGQMYRDVECVDEATGFPVSIETEVQTMHCGWTPIHICNRACDVDCRNAQELFNEIGIDY